MVSSRSSNKWKHKFPHQQQKLNTSLNICHEKYQNLEYFLVDNKQEQWYNYQPSAVVKGNSLIVNI